MLGLTSVPLVDALSQSVDVNTVDVFGRSPLSWSSQRGATDAVEFLLANGANTNLHDFTGCSNLAWAARAGHRKVAEQLLCRYHGTDVNATGTMDRAAIHRLADSYHYDKNFLPLLFQHGGDINAQTSRGESALMLAIDSHFSERATQLIRMGCQVATRDYWGHNALSYSVKENVHPTIRELIQHETDHVTELAEEGSFLHLVAANADLETLRILANAQLATRDIHRKRRDGLTASDVARQRRGIGSQWREAFRAFLISVTEIRVFGPEEAWSDSEDDVFEEAVEHQG